MAHGEVLPRLLVVDDIPLNRLVLRSLLANASYEVDCAEDGKAALEVTMTHDYALVLMDVDMPGLDGHATAAAMRDREIASGGRWKRPTIVALTADNRADARERSRDVGITAHIARPIAPQELLRTVKCVIATKPSPRERQLWCLDTYGALLDRFGEDRMHDFLSSMRARAVSMRNVIALADPDISNMKRMAHDLVAVGGMLGFEELAYAYANVQILDAVPTDRSAVMSAEQALREATQVVDEVLNKAESTYN